MPNVSAWKMLAQCSTRCHHMMQYSGYGMHGHGKEALQHFEMCGEAVQLDDVTFVCVLSACSHAGLVVEGLCYYLSMSIIYKISAKLEHYTCMVDLLGHAGHLQEAENMMKVMPCNPNMAVWMALLSACRFTVICGDGRICCKTSS